MSKFKVGDKVKVLDFRHESNLLEKPLWTYPMTSMIGETYEVTNVYLNYRDATRIILNGWNFAENWIELINETTNKTNMSLTQKFINAFKPEPYKTLREKGITNGDDMLTEEGKDLYINYMFQKDAETFKTEVADKMVDETK